MQSSCEPGCQNPSEMAERNVKSAEKSRPFGRCPIAPFFRFNEISKAELAEVVNSVGCAKVAKVVGFIRVLDPVELVLTDVVALFSVEGVAEAIST